MSFTSWLDDRIKTAEDNAVANVKKALSSDPEFVANLASQIAAALSAGLLNGAFSAITTKIESVPQNTTALMSTELQQLPQQIGAVLNIPAALASAFTDLPEKILAALKGGGVPLL